MRDFFGNIGFEKSEDGYKEYLPKTTQVSIKAHQREAFVSMFNFYMPPSLRFQPKDIYPNKTLLANFEIKILSLLPLSFISPFTQKKSIKTLDVSASYLINDYLGTLKHPKARFLSKATLKSSSTLGPKRPKLLVGRWIELIYKNRQTLFFMDLHDAFSNLVYERIKKVNRHKTVQVSDRGITIKEGKESCTPTFVMPFFDELDTKKMPIDAPIAIARETLRKGEFKNIYLVYPKTKEFKKHIQVRLPEMNEEEYKIKVIPYSFSFCMRKNAKRI